MKSPQCEVVRDRLPDYVAGILDEVGAAAVVDHVSSCSECRVEEGLVRALFESRPMAPEGLEARIQARVREEMGSAPQAGAKVLPMRKRRSWAPTWAMSAAALVVLSLGIGVVWQGQTPEVDMDPLEVAVDEPVPESWLWDDGIVAGAPLYDGLSDEDLETLIRELEG